MVEERSDGSYTSTTGKTVRFKPIGGLLSLIQRTYQDPEVPTRRIETVGGDHYDEPMDEESVKHPAVSEEDKARWQEYVEVREAVKAERWKRMLDACLRKGIEIDMPKGEGWIREYSEVFGLEVPDDPEDRRAFWARAEVIGGLTDEVAIVTGVRLAGMVRREVIDAAKATFPRKEGVGEWPAPGETGEEDADVVGPT